MQIDPLRVVEAVTAGVAFLAGGAIVLLRGEVKGLTTGAGMWLAGAIGLALGFGHWLIAAFASLAGLAILYAARHAERWYRSGGMNDKAPKQMSENRIVMPEENRRVKKPTRK